MPIITLKNGRSFNIDKNQSILDAACFSDVMLEHSCKTGRCGICVSTVMSGETITLQDEEALTDEQISSGVILTCCRSAACDVSLNIEDFPRLAHIRPKTLPCRIDSMRTLTDSVIEVVLRLPPNSKLDYAPGQYLEIILNDVRRSYSIANAPLSDNKIQLQIKKIKDGRLSRFWFEEAKINSLLRLEGPFGTFCLRDSMAKNLVFLATGTGIAPVKAILEELDRANNNTYDKIYLYWGARFKEDIYWSPNFPNLPIYFYPVLSREDDWSGKFGYVQDNVLNDKIKLQNSVVYACGSKTMIDSARLQLIESGLANTNFYSDAFVSSK